MTTSSRQQTKSHHRPRRAFLRGERVRIEAHDGQPAATGEYFARGTPKDAVTIRCELAERGWRRVDVDWVFLDGEGVLTRVRYGAILPE